jgi:hypothetical protein
VLCGVGKLAVEGLSKLRAKGMTVQTRSTADDLLWLAFLSCFLCMRWDGAAKDSGQACASFVYTNKVQSMLAHRSETAG